MGTTRIWLAYDTSTKHAVGNGTPLCSRLAPTKVSAGHLAACASWASLLLCASMITRRVGVQEVPVISMPAILYSYHYCCRSAQHFFCRLRTAATSRPRRKELLESRSAIWCSVHHFLSRAGAKSWESFSCCDAYSNAARCGGACLQKCLPLRLAILRHVQESSRLVTRRTRQTRGMARHSKLSSESLPGPVGSRRPATQSRA